MMILNDNGYWSGELYYNETIENFETLLQYCFEQIQDKNAKDFENALIEEIRKYEFEDVEEIVGYFNDNIYSGNGEVLEYYNTLREKEEYKSVPFHKCAGKAIKEFLESEVLYEELAENVKGVYTNGN